MCLIVKRFTQRHIYVNAVELIVNGGRQQVNRRFAFTREIAEQLRMAHFMKLRFPETCTRFKHPVVLVAVFNGIWIVGVVDLRVTDTVSSKHDINVNLEVEYSIISDSRIS